MSDSEPENQQYNEYDSDETEETEESEESVTESDSEESEESDSEEIKFKLFSKHDLEKILGNNQNYKIIKIVPDDERISSETICWNEATEAVGIRTSQIENGSPVLTNVDGFTDPNDMAVKEFYDRKSPLILEREMSCIGNVSIVEHWEVCKMGFPRYSYKIPVPSYGHFSEMYKKFNI
jgi:hypothetical protein